MFKEACMHPHCTSKDPLLAFSTSNRHSHKARQFACDHTSEHLSSSDKSHHSSSPPSHLNIGYCSKLYHCASSKFPTSACMALRFRCTACKHERRLKIRCEHDSPFTIMLSRICLNWTRSQHPTIASHVKKMCKEVSTFRSQRGYKRAIVKVCSSS